MKHDKHRHTWELVLEPHSFPRGSLYYGPQHVAFFFPLLQLSNAADVLADVDPLQLEIALPLITRYGYHIAELIDDVVSLAHGKTSFAPPAPIDGWQREILRLAPPAEVTPLWAPFLRCACLTSQSPTKYTALGPAGAVVINLKANINVVGVPASMPSGAAAWPQLLRLVLEMLVGTKEPIRAETAEENAVVVHVRERPLAPAYIWAGDFDEPGAPGERDPIGVNDLHVSLKRFKRHGHRPEG
ncbi:hypothetical protein CC85DRAFT_283368 [Cutaneotrichosporon oleaginosum]|uniref:Uncharacterized protein n=1 Tax=Cutaneotrichosporon oleaginosum TaxID=879819 RepID=A0A0J0XUI9_9TREE|nr:uncharacterized protein CC85DRAFT_283368 [Cutaneotrichosporon oleaginosum]KLT44735.1 hypothetical protein CC85DRAFT_283368 [Cutaneotrichosporon oleaginosum]TXT07721.1 hypothetical protein COLE_04645 [Cutaneotrichosporon oleaginosum]